MMNNGYDETDGTVVGTFCDTYDFYYNDKLALTRAFRSEADAMAHWDLAVKTRDARLLGHVPPRVERRTR